MLYWVGFVICWLISKVFFPIRVFGRENLPINQAYILASNHVSNLDPVIVGLASGRAVSFMAKDSLFKNFIFGSVLKQLNAFPVLRGKPDIRAIRESLKRLQRGCPLVLFPEGTRKKNEQSASLEASFAGVALLAGRASVPVVPVYIQGSGDVLPPGQKFFRRGAVKVFFGSPQQINRSDDPIVATAAILSAIYSLPNSRQS